MTICKICGAPAPLLGTVDFNRACEGPLHALPHADRPIAYNRCETCHFVFTAAFDRFDTQDFRREIYNDEYILVDPSYELARPANNARTINLLFGAAKAGLTILDYGGGNGRLAEELRARGFRHVTTYDALSETHNVLPTESFDLVCCFETLEHLPDPRATIREIAGLVKQPGLVFFSTAVQPGDFTLDWEYVAPRNGHISIFSDTALRHAWKQVEFHLCSANTFYHAAFRTLPGFASHALRPV